jgi:DHA1 family inner membrane transport protein
MGVVAATAAVALMFATTPFLISPIAERYGVSEGAVGLVSVAQVGAFAVANFVMPRLFRPSGGILRIAAASLVVLNLLSMVPSVYGILVGLRLVAGFAAGSMTWLAWTDAMQQRRSMSAVAAAGPLAMLVGAPIISVVSTQGDRAVYLLLALVTVPAIFFFAPVGGEKRRPGSVSGSRSNRVLMAAMWMLTFFGSALFINQALVARDIQGLSMPAASLAFSLNATGGLIGARLSSRHRHPGWFLASAGAAAWLSVNGPTAFFFIGMAWWGFAFWMGVPGVMEMISARSLQPSERAGDTQGLMAVGRAFGPAMGGLFVNAGALITLSWITGLGLATSGATVIGVKEGRERLPPSDPRTVATPPGDPGAQPE